MGRRGHVEHSATASITVRSSRIALGERTDRLLTELVGTLEDVLPPACHRSSHKIEQRAYHLGTISGGADRPNGCQGWWSGNGHLNLCTVEEASCSWKTVAPRRRTSGSVADGNALLGSVAHNVSNAVIVPSIDAREMVRKRGSSFAEAILLASSSQWARLPLPA